MNEQFIELESDVLRFVRELSGKTVSLFTILIEGISKHEEKKVSLQEELEGLHELIVTANRGLLTLLSDPKREDAGVFSHFLTYTRRLRDKLVNFHRVRVNENPQLSRGEN